MTAYLNKIINDIIVGWSCAGSRLFSSNKKLIRYHKVCVGNRTVDRTRYLETNHCTLEENMQHGALRENIQHVNENYMMKYYIEK